MGKIKDKIKKGIAIGAISLASLVPIKANAQNIDGWLEASLGTPTANLRLYPSASYAGINLGSLIDLNGSYQFSKTDLSLEKLTLNKGNVRLKPVLTLFQDQYDGATLRIGPNVSYAVPGKAFGFAELGIDLKDIRKNSQLYTYNSAILPKNMGRVGVFTASPTDDLKSTYAEIEATGPSYKGIAPYGRVNFMKGKKASYQVGVSVKPKDFVRRRK